MSALLWVLVYLHSIELAAQDSTQDSNLAQPIQRVITLAPHLTEVIYAAGAGDKLVGVIDYSDYPPAALDLPVIGNANGLNLEAIIALQPDLLISWKSGNRPKDIAKLKALGLQVWETDIADLTDIPHQIRLFGQKLGTQAEANSLASELEAELKRIKTNYLHQHPIKVFYQLWHQPLMTVNGKQFIGQAIRLCGAENIFKDLPNLATEVNLEAVLVKNPQVILLGGTHRLQTQWKQQWLAWQKIEAVNTQRIYSLNTDLYQRPTPRFIRGLDRLCRIINQ